MTASRITNDNETMSGGRVTTNDKEWQRVANKWQDAANNNKWQGMTANGKANENKWELAKKSHLIFKMKQKPI